MWEIRFSFKKIDTFKNFHVIRTLRVHVIHNVRIIRGASLIFLLCLGMDFDSLGSWIN